MEEGWLKTSKFGGKIGTNFNFLEQKMRQNIQQ